MSALPDRCRCERCGNDLREASIDEQIVATVAPLAAGDLLTPTEVAELLRVPRSTVYALARERRLPHAKVGRRLVFDRRELAAWIRDQRVEAWS